LLQTRKALLLSPQHVAMSRRDRAAIHTRNLSICRRRPICKRDDEGVHDLTAASRAIASNAKLAPPAQAAINAVIAASIKTTAMTASRGAMGQDDVGSERGQFRRVPTNLGSIGRSPAGVDPHVATDAPAQ
jgi:hypothetical protein